MTQRKRTTRSQTSWDHLAGWYDGWVGPAGSEYHRELAIPLVLELLNPAPGEALLDVGCGQGPLAPAVLAEGMTYTGLDVSPRLLERARRMHGKRASFVEGDATKLHKVDGLKAGSFHAACFLLSIQNIDPLADALSGVAWALKPAGRLAIVMTHPCFRVPRQSGWGWDAGRRLSYRRVDRYLGRLAVPMKPLRGRAPVISFHRPLEDYFSALSDAGFTVEALREVAVKGTTRVTASDARNPDIPTFLGLRARITAGPR
jgi:ubiquinone/menaquinone biosynthesis C-methylase UbiE